MLGDFMGQCAIATSAKRMLVLIIATGVAACAATPNPAPAGTDTAWHGNLTSGSKFGAAIGQADHDARQEMLAAGYGFEGDFTCSSEVHISGCQAGARYLKFQPVQPGEKGHIYLQIEDGLVSRISWALTPVAYIDS